MSKDDYNDDKGKNLEEKNKKTKLDIENAQKELEEAIQELKKLKDPDRPA